MKNSEYEKIEFKGSKEGIIIDLNDERDFDTIADVIVSKIESSKSFFNGARIYKIESEFLGDDYKEKLKKLITSKFNIDFYKPEDKKIEGKTTIKDEINKVDEINNIECEIKVLEDEDSSEDKCSEKEIVVSEEESDKDYSTRYISRMRSGDFIESDGNIVVMSDMNSGSKVVSGKDVLIMGDMCVGAKAVAVGNVVVFGNLFGFVHAGADGDKNSYIAAKNLRPTILQIADIIAEAPEETDSSELVDENTDGVESEIAFISENQIIIETQIGK